MENYGVLSPVPVFSIKDFYKLLDIDDHDLRTCIYLGQARVNYTKVIQGHDHRNSWTDLLHRLSLGGVLGSPKLACEVK
jgi:hypothetical protein